VGNHSEACPPEQEELVRFAIEPVLSFFMKLKPAAKQSMFAKAVAKQVLINYKRYKIKKAEEPFFYFKKTIFFQKEVRK
jgi:hypothetical protein